MPNGKELLPPALKEKSFRLKLRQFVRKTASPQTFKGSDQRGPIEIENFIRHKLHHNKVVILLLGVFGQSLVILFAVE